MFGSSNLIYQSHQFKNIPVVDEEILETTPKFFPKSALAPSWRWLVVVGCFFGTFITCGIAYSCGLFYLDWVETFKDQNKNVEVMVSWVSSANLGLLSLAGPLGSALTHRFGFRRVLMVGGLTTALGIFAAAWSPNVYILILTFGVVAGASMGMCFTPFATLLFYYFPECTVMATSIGISGGGCGSFIMPLILKYLMEFYGWRGALIIASGIGFNLCICGALIRPIQRETHCPNTGKRIDTLNLHVFKNIDFLLLTIHCFVFSFGLSIVYVHITALTERRAGVSGMASSFVIMSIGISNFVGRLAHGLIASCPRTDILTHYLISYLISGISALLISILQSYEYIILLSCLLGFMIAPYATLLPRVIADIIGDEFLTSGYGYLMSTGGIGIMLGAPIAAVLYESSGMYMNSFLLGGAMMILSIFFLLHAYWVYFMKWINGRKAINKIATKQQNASLMGIECK